MQQKNSHPVRIWTEYMVARVLLATLRTLPLPLANRVARLLTQLLDLAMPRLRRVALLNLAFAFPETTVENRQRIVDGVFRSVARILVALARFPHIDAASVRHWIRYRGLENYSRAKEKGKGVLVATAHFGNWELSAFAHALMTETMNVMVRPLDNPLIDELVETRRTLSGNRLIQKKDAARAVLKALRANEAVGILADQNTTPAEGVFVHFFGKAACASSAFVKLAHHSGAAVVPGFALWEEKKGHYDLVFLPEIPMTGDVAADTQRIHSAFEEIIRKHPDQWLWIHRRWKTRPPGEPPLY